MVKTSVKTTEVSLYEFMLNCDEFCLERCQFDFNNICSYKDPYNETSLQPGLGDYILECQIDTKQIDADFKDLIRDDAMSCDSLPKYLQSIYFITKGILANSFQRENSENRSKKLFWEEFTTNNCKNLYINDSMTFSELEEQLCYSNMLTELNCYTILYENGFSDEFLVNLSQQQKLPFSLLSFATKFGFLDNSMKESFKNKLFELLVDTPNITPQEFSNNVDLHFQKSQNEITNIEKCAKSMILEKSIIDEREITHNVKGRKYAKKLGSKTLKDSKVRKVRRKIEKLSKQKMNKDYDSSNIIDFNIINETANKEIEKIDFESIIMASEYCVDVENAELNNHQINHANLTTTTDNILNSSDNSRFYNNFFKEIEQSLANKDNTDAYQDENVPNLSEIEEIRRMSENEKIIPK